MGVYREKMVKPYSTIPTVIMKDPDLSLKERGMLITLYSLPEDWRFSVEGMAKILKDGVSSIKSTLTELVAKGYVEKRRSRTKEGHFSAEDLYLRLPTEMANAPPKGVPSDGFPPVVNPSKDIPPTMKSPDENRGESNNHRSNIKEYKKKYIASSARKNRFNNFTQRKYNYDDIERKLMAAQFAEWRTSEQEDTDVYTGQEKQAGCADNTETKELPVVQNIKYEEQGSP